MKLFAIVLLLFLLAFAGLAVGLIFRRRGLRGGCGHAPNQQHDCHCEAELDKGLHGQCDEKHECCEKQSGT